MIKIAINAGHGLNTAGKRCLKSIDPKETREWSLNSRIVEKVTEKLKDYDGYELLRIDDPTGKTDIPLKERTDKANGWNADVYIAVHHNAGIGGKSGGGIMVFTYLDVNDETKKWQEDIYKSLISATGLAGNRSQPLATGDLHECRETKMPAVLIENGFMDSKTDTPVILTEDFADKSAAAIVDVLIKKGKLTKTDSQVQTPTEVKPQDNEQISVYYQVWDSRQKRWLPQVRDLEDYAGIYGHDICALYASLSRGNIIYKIHYKNGVWLPEVKNRQDYAGLYNKSADGLMMKTDTGKRLKYAVHLRRTEKWLPFVDGYDENDSEYGYAGIIGQEIDAVKIFLE